MFVDFIYKGFKKPKPHIQRPLDSEINESETCDALSGGTWIYQLKKGHRYSTDDLLVAWYGSTHSGRVEKVLDLGSGIGSVAQVVAWRFPFATFTTIEAQTVSYELSQKSVQLNGYAPRFRQILGDIRDDSLLQPSEKFDLILGSPPYWPETDGVVSEHPQKRACRFEVRGGVEAYCEAASKRLDLAGSFFIVFPTIQEKRTLQAAKDHQLQCVRRKRIILKEGEDSLLSLYHFQKKDDLEATFVESLGEEGFLETPLMIRNQKGEITLEYSLVKRSIGFSA